MTWPTGGEPFSPPVDGSCGGGIEPASGVRPTVPVHMTIRCTGPADGRWRNGPAFGTAAVTICPTERCGRGYDAAVRHQTVGGRSRGPAPGAVAPTRDDARGHDDLGRDGVGQEQGHRLGEAVGARHPAPRAGRRCAGRAASPPRRARPGRCTAGRPRTTASAGVASGRLPHGHDPLRLAHERRPQQVMDATVGDGHRPAATRLGAHDAGEVGACRTDQEPARLEQQPRVGEAGASPARWRARRRCPGRADRRSSGASSSAYGMPRPPPASSSRNRWPWRCGHVLGLVRQPADAVHAAGPRRARWRRRMRGARAARRAYPGRRWRPPAAAGPWPRRARPGAARTWRHRRRR